MIRDEVREDSEEYTFICKKCGKDVTEEEMAKKDKFEAVIDGVSEGIKNEVH